MYVSYFVYRLEFLNMKSNNCGFSGSLTGLPVPKPFRGQEFLRDGVLLSRSLSLSQSSPTSLTERLKKECQAFGSVTCYIYEALTNFVNQNGWGGLQLIIF